MRRMERMLVRPILLDTFHVDPWNSRDNVEQSQSEVQDVDLQ